MGLAEKITFVRTYPTFNLMRSVARFGVVRNAVKGARSVSHKSRWDTYCDEQRRRMPESLIQGPSPDTFADTLDRDGVALGLQLSPSAVDELRNIAETSICYADRIPDRGFPPAQREEAERALGKPILLAQYFNLDQNPIVARLRDDPYLRLVAARYLRSMPTHVSTNMWWTFPVVASDEDRRKHAHYFHNDIDDYAFMKFFIYLTDVDADDGAHVCVPGSHREPLIKQTSDYWKIRRYTDEEVAQAYGKDKILYIGGKKGTVFAEDTLCIHKGNTPTRNARLVLQFQYALFDYTIQRDDIDPSRLKRIV